MLNLICRLFCTPQPSKVRATKGDLSLFSIRLHFISFYFVLLIF